jgi:predicted metal-dependent phosphoesterase TrpH
MKQPVSPLHPGRKAVDLHTHSTASDGSCEPERLISLALELGLSALALTDHDTLDGLERAESSAKGTPLLFVRGVEIEIEHESGEFHLLGLGFDAGRASVLDEALSQVQAARRLRNHRMVEKLRQGGFDVSMEELAQIAGGQIVSRAHFARLLVKKRAVNSIDAAFKRLIGKGMPYYEPRACLSLSDATAFIRAASGVAVIAHPVSLGLRGPALRTFVAGCRDQGVVGVEAWHPNQTLKECNTLARLARSLGMAVSGGSDFHGEHIPQRKLGRSSGGREIPDSLLDALFHCNTPDAGLYCR